jgi:hypothetical protein
VVDSDLELALRLARIETRATHRHVVTVTSLFSELRFPRGDAVSSSIRRPVNPGGSEICLFALFSIRIDSLRCSRWS